MRSPGSCTAVGSRQASWRNWGTRSEGSGVGPGCAVVTVASDAAWRAVPSGEAHALSSLVETLLAERREARANKDFAASDRIRDTLAAAGILVEDGKHTTTWSIP